MIAAAVAGLLAALAVASWNGVELAWTVLKGVIGLVAAVVVLVVFGIIGVLVVMLPWRRWSRQAWQRLTAQRPKEADPRLLRGPLAPSSTTAETSGHVNVEGAGASAGGRPDDQDDRDILAWVRESARRAVAAGFDSDASIMGQARSAADESKRSRRGQERLRQAARRIVRQVIRDHARQEATWPEVTDCDHLDRALDAMERDGILARENFACCMSCGTHEIQDDVANARSTGHAVRGYVFYHQQDTEWVVDTGCLYLAFGATNPLPAGVTYDDATIAVGRGICAALEAEGLHVAWDGSPSQRIAVTLVWRSRRSKWAGLKHHQD